MQFVVQGTTVGRCGFSRPVALAVLFVGLATLTLPAAAQEPGEHFKSFAKGSQETVDHSAWDRLLKAYVAAGTDGLNRADYARFKNEAHNDLKAYVKSLEAVDVATLDRPEQFAYWANLYNATTIDVVLDHYPVKSIKDINLGGGLRALFSGGPWKAKVLRVNGMDLSLDDIEHGILRPVFADPRVHYAVNCASIGCPNLGRDAFTGANLEAQLDAGAKAYINHPRGFRAENGLVIASSIYDWFREDFGGTEKGVLDHARRYADPALKQYLDGVSTISDYAYDWSLNDTQ